MISYNMEHRAVGARRKTTTAAGEQAAALAAAGPGSAALAMEPRHCHLCRGQPHASGGGWRLQTKRDAPGPVSLATSSCDAMLFAITPCTMLGHPVRGGPGTGMEWWHTDRHGLGGVCGVGNNRHAEILKTV